MVTKAMLMMKSLKFTGIHDVFRLWWIVAGVSPLVSATVNIVGAGATFPRNVYQVWMSTYAEVRREYADVSITYAAKGSGFGLARIKDEISPGVDFAGSDSLLTDADYAAHPDLQMLPTMAGAIVLAYNLPGRPKLTLSREQIVGIFNGTITSWNHTSFRDTNPDLDLAPEKIQVIVRAEKSGTTEIMTRALSSFSEEWRKYPGIFSKGLSDSSEPIFWNGSVITHYGRGVFDVLFLLSVFPYSIGYLALADAVDDGVTYASVINKNGDEVFPDAESVQKSIESFGSSLTSRLTASLTDSEAPKTYPIVGYTYFVVRRTNNSDCGVAKELLRFIMWFLSSSVAERSCAELGFALVSKNVIEKINNIFVSKMYCNGNHVATLVQKDFTYEEEQERYRALELPLKIALPIVITLFLFAVAAMIYLRVKASRALERHDWSIAIEDVIFFEPATVSFARSRSRSQKSQLSMESKRDAFTADEASMSDVIHWPAMWNNHTVSVKIQHPFVLKPLSNRSKRDLCACIGNFVHENVVRFFGLTAVAEERYIVTEYCSKGILQDIIHDDKLNLTASLKFSIALDIIHGLQFLHANNMVHGHLKTDCCLLDARWTVKIADWEIGLVKSTVCEEQKTERVDSQPHLYSAHEDENKMAIRSFWKAPEIIKSNLKENPSKSSDVYSFAICLHEIFTRDEPFSEHADNISPREVLVLILMNNLRPMPTDDIPSSVRQVMEISWADNPESRPTSSQVVNMLKKANPVKRSVMDSMMETLEEYASELEKTIEEKATELAFVKENALRANSTILPSWLTAKIANNEVLKSTNLYKSCIACVGFSGISSIAEVCGTDTVIDVLNDIYDQIIQTVKEENFIIVPRVKSPVIISPACDQLTTHAWLTNIVEVLLGFISKARVANRKHHRQENGGINLKFTLHVGSATISYLQPLSQIMAFGRGIETVNILGDYSNPNCLLVTEEVYEIFGKDQRYQFASCGKIRLKDKSSIMTYWLTDNDTSVDLEGLDDGGFTNMACVDC